MGRFRPGGGWTVRRAWVLLFCSAVASAQETPSLAPLGMTQAIDQEMVVLVRARQLQHWMQQPVSLEVSLCIQDRYQSLWPITDDAPPLGHQWNALRIIHGVCQAAIEDSADPSRLVTAGKAQFIERLARLRGVSQSLDSCYSLAAPAVQVDRCLQGVARRPLTELERRVLFADPGQSSPN